MTLRMPKHPVLTVELDPELRDAFVAEAKAMNRAPSHVMRDLVRDFLRQQREAREHDAWFRSEVKQALREADDPAVRRIPNEVVQANWQRKREELIRLVDGQGRQG